MPSRLTRGQIAGGLFAAVMCFLNAGCAKKTVQAAAPIPTAPTPSAGLERPMTTAPDTTANPPSEPVSPPPPVSADSTTSPPVEVPKTKPPRPPKPSTASEPAPEPSTDQPAHPPAPQISPQLSPSDQATLERRTNDDISAAEKNLQQATGRQLSAAQHDLYEKIQSFVSQSRDASKAGDLARAQNLSQKARLLSVELINSL